MASIAALPVAAIGGEMAFEKAFNAGMGNRVATKDFTYETGKVDNDGNPETVTKRKGQPFNLNNIPENQRELAKTYSKVAPTKVGTAISGAMSEFRDKSGNLFSRISPFSQAKEPLKGTDNSSTDSSKTDQHQSPDEHVGEKTKHKYPFSKDNPIIPKQEKVGNTAKKLLDRIDEQSKANERLHDAGKLTDEQWIARESESMDLREKVKNGTIHSKELSNRANSLKTF